jgi:hypothetical protein
VVDEMLLNEYMMNPGGKLMKELTQEFTKRLRVCVLDNVENVSGYATLYLTADYHDYA